MFGCLEANIHSLKLNSFCLLGFPRRRGIPPRRRLHLPSRAALGLMPLRDWTPCERRLRALRAGDRPAQQHAARETRHHCCRGWLLVPILNNFTVPRVVAENELAR